MKTIKGNKKDLIKEYFNFCNDLKLCKYYINNKLYFSKMYIENEIKNNGLFNNNNNFKTIDINAIQNEILKILNNEIRIKK